MWIVKIIQIQTKIMELYKVCNEQRMMEIIQVSNNVMDIKVRNNQSAWDEMDSIDPAAAAHDKVDVEAVFVQDVDR